MHRTLRFMLLRAILVAWITPGLLPAQPAGQQTGSAQTAAWPKPKPTSHSFAKWEKSVAAFEAADRKSPPPGNPVLFVGSSTIVRWKSLAADFPGTVVLNRGFGGSQIKDCTHYAPRMIFPYEPRMIFMRSGSNDISAGWPAEDVFADFKSFVTTVRGRFPGLPIAFIGVFPTIKRWEQVAEGNKLNDLVATYCRETTGLTFIDCRTLTLDAQGRPRPELFAADKLHLSEEGYKVLAEAVRPHLPK